jgi:hypothetical protein
MKKEKNFVHEMSGWAIFITLAKSFFHSKLKFVGRLGFAPFPRLGVKTFFIKLPHTFPQ